MQEASKRNILSRSANSDWLKKNDSICLMWEANKLLWTINCKQFNVSKQFTVSNSPWAIHHALMISQIAHVCI